MFDSGDLGVTNLDGYQAEFTEHVGVLLFSTYQLVLVLVFLNMIIALMTRSIEAVQVTLIGCACLGPWRPCR